MTEIHRDMPATEYHTMRQRDGVPYCTASALATMDRKSPAHALHLITHGIESTPSMERGTAVHAATLEPDVFAATYVSCGDDDMRRGTKAWAEIEAEHPDAVIVKPKELAEYEAMNAAVWAHDVASKILRQCGPDRREVSIVWDRDGYPCRARPDLIATRYVADLKTCRDASLHPFQGGLWTYRRHIQAAWYHDAAHRAGYEVDAFAWIAIEAAPPYAVAVYRASDEVMQFGKRRVAELWDQWRACVDSGDWPGLEGGIIDLPHWVDYEDELQFSAESN